MGRRSVGWNRPTLDGGGAEDEQGNEGYPSKSGGGPPPVLRSSTAEGGQSKTLRGVGYRTASARFWTAAALRRFRTRGSPLAHSITFDVSNPDITQSITA